MQKLWLTAATKANAYTRRVLNLGSSNLPYQNIYPKLAESNDIRKPNPLQDQAIPAVDKARDMAKQGLKADPSRKSYKEAEDRLKTRLGAALPGTLLRPGTVEDIEAHDRWDDLETLRRCMIIARTAKAEWAGNCGEMAMVAFEYLKSLGIGPLRNRHSRR